MIINFIHIPKNGGVSINQIYFRKDELLTKIKPKIRLLVDSTIVLYNGHNTDVFNKNINNQLIVIRNPITGLYQVFIMQFKSGLMTSNKIFNFKKY